MSEISVLIIEDEPLIAEDLADYLKDANYACAGIAYNSEKALEMLATNQPDIALIDIKIEGSMNGIEVAQIIQKTYDIPFIFLTSHSDKETLSKAKLTNPHGYIIKPFDEQELISTLELAISKHTSVKR